MEFLSFIARFVRRQRPKRPGKMRFQWEKNFPEKRYQVSDSPLLFSAHVMRGLGSRNDDLDTLESQQLDSTVVCGILRSKLHMKGN